MKEFKFRLITDTHYFATSLGAYGKEYEEFMDFEQKCFAETAAINDAVLEFLKNSKEADTILIPGDLSFNGEKESHREFSEKLKNLQKSGKNIFVVTAGHDIEPKPFSYPGKSRTAVEGIEFSQLTDYYGDFGYNNAVDFNEEHLSYTADLNENIRLLALCNDTANGRNIEYDEDFLNWIENQCKKAKDDGKMMIAMEHYPLLPGQPILSLIPDARQKNSKKVIETLADNGVHIIFTGHMHNQSINVTETEKGNKFYDVCTGSAIGCPAFMRLVTIQDESTVKIESFPVPEFEYDKKEKSGEQYLKDQFDRMILSVFHGMKDNPEKILERFGAGGKTSLYKPVQKIGNIICNKTVGEVAKIFFVKAPDEIKNEKFIDFATDIVRNLLCGDQPFTEETASGKMILKVLKRLSPVLKILNRKVRGSQGEKLDFYEVIKHSIGNYGISDYNATLKLK